MTSGAEPTVDDVKAILERIDFNLVLRDDIRFRGRERLKGARVKVANVDVHARYSRTERHP